MSEKRRCSLTSSHSRPYYDEGFNFRRNSLPNIYTKSNLQKIDHIQTKMELHQRLPVNYNIYKTQGESLRDYLDSNLLKIYQKLYNNIDSLYKQWIRSDHTLCNPTTNKILKNIDPNLHTVISFSTIQQTTRKIQTMKLKHVLIISCDQEKTLGDDFLENCHSLLTLDFAMPFVRSINNRWMMSCDSLHHVKFSGMSSITQVGKGWMSNCMSLTTPIFAGMHNLRKVGHRWMAECTQLQNPSFDGLDQLEHVGNDWMYRCKSLINPDFHGLNTLMHVNDDWMRSCESLVEPTFDGLSQLESIGKGWLSLCDSLSKPHFIGMHNVKYIGDGWMMICQTLAQPNFKGLSNLKRVGADWMYSCRNLHAPYLKNLIALTHVGNRWMFACKKLTQPDFSCLHNLQHIGFASFKYTVVDIQHIKTKISLFNPHTQHLESPRGNGAHSNKSCSPLHNGRDPGAE
jgi:hypothetical protein